MPYLAKPAWLTGGPDQAVDKPGSSAGGGMSPTPPGSALASGGATPPGQQGTGFVNLSAYLNQNRPMAEAYVDRHVGQPIGQQAFEAQGEAKDFAGKWNENEQARKDAEGYNKTIDEAKNAYNPINDQPAGMEKPGTLAGRAAWDRWTKYKGEVDAWKQRMKEYEEKAKLAGSPYRDIPAQLDVPGSLTGKASAANANRQAAMSMEGRAALLRGAAGRGYGYGSFDAYLSGGKPWGNIASGPMVNWRATAAAMPKPAPVPNQLNAGFNDAMTAFREALGTWARRRNNGS